MNQWMNEWMNEWMSDEGDCITALATQGPLNIEYKKKKFLLDHTIFLMNYFLEPTKH